MPPRACLWFLHPWVLREAGADTKLLGLRKECQLLRSRRPSRMIGASGPFIVSAFSPPSQRFAAFIHRRRYVFGGSKDGATLLATMRARKVFMTDNYWLSKAGNASIGSFRHPSRLHCHACRANTWEEAGPCRSWRQREVNPKTSLERSLSSHEKHPMDRTVATVMPTPLVMTANLAGLTNLMTSRHLV